MSRTAKRRSERETPEAAAVRGGLFDSESPMSIELRRIMIRIGRQLDLDRKRTLLITSAERGEGKSLFSLHFALVLASHLPKRVLLLDGDVRRPVQHTVFQSALSPGFCDLLKGEAPVEKAVRSTKVKNLDFMPAGETGGRPSRLFGSHRIFAALDQLHKVYDLIILDSPPVVPVSDPLHFLEAVDGVLYLVMAGHTPKDLSPPRRGDPPRRRRQHPGRGGQQPGRGAALLLRPEVLRVRGVAEEATGVGPGVPRGGAHGPRPCGPAECALRPAALPGLHPWFPDCAPDGENGTATRRSAKRKRTAPAISADAPPAGDAYSQGCLLHLPQMRKRPPS